MPDLKNRALAFRYDPVRNDFYSYEFFVPFEKTVTEKSIANQHLRVVVRDKCTNIKLYCYHF